jgi:hypothetical protein
MRKSTVFLAYLAINLAIIISLFIHAAFVRRGEAGKLEFMAVMVRQLGLTDLCLFTEARYTRHPSMADLHTPFQDYPFSLEHFPSGSIVPVPPSLKTGSVIGDSIRK